MYFRRSITIPLEGVYFLCVLAFIVGGATLREINLLVILAGMMLGPLIAGGFMGWANLKRIAVRRRSPARVHAGEPLVVELTAANERGRWPVWSVVATDKITPVAANSGAVVTPPVSAEVLFSHVGPGQELCSAYRVRMHQRGEYQLGPLQLTTRFPLSLLCVHFNAAQTSKVIVLPRLGTLTAKWRQRVEREQLGSRQSRRQKGMFEGDYYGLRDWRPGDSRRWIHWRTSARLGRLAVRQFEQQRNRDLALLVDLWLPEKPSDEQRQRVEKAISFAATVIDELCRAGGSRLVVVVAGEQLEARSSLGSAALSRELLDILARAHGGAKHSPADVWSVARREMRAGMPVVWLSTRAASQDSALSNSDATTDDTATSGGVATLAEPVLLELEVGSEEAETYFEFAE